MGVPGFSLALLTLGGHLMAQTTVRLAGAKVQGGQLIAGPSTTPFCD